jgi:uncharacterized protein with HEPN domain
MRREEGYLTDMVEAAESINKFLAGIDRQTFLQDDLLRSAVLQKLSIMDLGTRSLFLALLILSPFVEEH